MLLLVLSHRDHIRLIEQDVRCHQAGIGEEAAVDVLRVFRGLVLELGHAAELAEHGVAVEDPAQLRVLVDVGLDKEGVLLRVQAAGDILGQLLQRPAAQGGGVMAHRNGVEIRHKVVAVELLCPGPPVPYRPQVGAQCQITAGLDTGEHHFFLVHGCLLLLSDRLMRVIWL